MKTSRWISVLTIGFLCLLSFLHVTTALKKQLNSTCKVVSATTPDIDSSYEDEDEEDLNGWNGQDHDHMYKRSVVDVDPFFMHEDECDETHQLKCISGTCQIHCHNEHHIFDSIKQKCLGKAGYACGRHGKHRFCVENAKCDLGYCSCEKGFGNKDGYCVDASDYKEICSAERPCDKASGMDCINGKCECALGSENQWYEPSNQTCYSYPEGECTSDALCANNTFCSVDMHDDNDNAIGTVYVKRCQCRRGFMLSGKSKSCMAAWGTKCQNTPCHENFKCAEGKCQCHNPSYQILHNSNIMSQCIGLVGSTCSSLDPVGSCIENAECVAGVCTCIKGYSSGTGNKGKKCLLDFGQPCQYVPSHLVSNCNYLRGLTCLDGVCACLDSIHVYNNSTQSCIPVKNSTTTGEKGKSDDRMTSDAKITGYANDAKMQSDKQFAYAMGSSPKPSIFHFLTVSLIFSWNVFIL